MKKMELHKLVLGPVMTNVYMPLNTETREVVLVDPADSPDRIVAKIREIEGKPAGILLTHGHFDHIMAVEEIRTRYQIPVYACREEETMLFEPTVNMTAYQSRAVSIRPDRLLQDQETFSLGGFSFQMLHTPGHTVGSCCYYVPEEAVLFSGDTLFLGSCGRTDFAGGSMRQMHESLQRLMELPEETDVYPGHDAPTTIAYEKRNNPFV